MKTYGGVEVLVDPFLSSALDGSCQFHELAALPPATELPLPIRLLS
jgi:hypothetical protein